MSLNSQGGERLLASDDDEGGKQTSCWRSDQWNRHVVLAVYSYITATQSLLWMTWSSVPDVSRAYLNISDGTMDLWLDWGPVAFICSVFFASYLLSVRRDGLQLSIRIASVLCFLSALIRCIPVAYSDDDLHNGASHDTVVAIIHLCQFINGAAAPFVVVSPALLSLLWFPEEQRNGATAVANVANALGRGVGFFLGPALVQSTSDMPTLLLVELGIALLPVVAAFTILPSGPQVPPSKAAVMEEQKWDEADEGWVSEEGGRLTGSIVGEVSSSLAVPSFLLLCVAGGLEMAIYGAWSGTLPSVLTNTGQYSDAQAGAFGSVNTFAGILGGLAVGVLTDMPGLRNHLRAVIMVLLLAATLCFGLIAAALPPFSLTSLAGLQSNYPALLALCSLAGLLRGGTDPLFFELTAESVAPIGVPAGTAGAILTFWYHAILCGLLGVPAAPLQTSAMAAMAVCLAVAVLLMVPVKVKYTRR